MTHLSPDPNSVIKCSEAKELLPAIAENLIDAESDSSLFEHISNCESCQEDLALYDLCSLSLETHDEASTTNQDSTTIRFRLSPTFIAAAAAILVCVSAASLHFSEESTAPASAAQVIPQTEVLDRTPDGRFLIRTGNTHLLVDPTQLTESDQPHAADYTPVYTKPAKPNQKLQTATHKRPTR